MKKTMAFLLTLALLLTGLPAALALEAADVEGVWYLNMLESGGISMEPGMLGLEMTLTLNADGSTVMEAMQAQEAGTWTLAGDTVQVQDNESTLAFTLTEDGSLSGEIQGMTATFGRERVSETFIPAPVVPAAALSDFDGDWTGAQVSIGGLTLPIQSSGMSFGASISAGRVTLHSVTGEDDSTEEMAGTLEDGALVIPAESAGSNGPMRLELREDGMISMNLQAGETEVLIYLVRAEPAA